MLPKNCWREANPDSQSMMPQCMKILIFPGQSFGGGCPNPPKVLYTFNNQKYSYASKH